MSDFWKMVGVKLSNEAVGVINRFGVEAKIEFGSYLIAIFSSL